MVFVVSQMVIQPLWHGFTHDLGIIVGWMTNDDRARPGNAGGDHDADTGDTGDTGLHGACTSW